MKELLYSLLKAPLWSSVFAWLVCQLIKGIRDCISEKKWSICSFLKSGGMPSSHTASVIALSSFIANTQGFASPLFSICVVFSVIVMYDAVGVRQETGKQSKIINEITRLSFAQQKNEHENKLSETVGHSLREVVAGALIGTVVGILATAIVYS